MRNDDVLAEALKDAGWELYDAAMYASHDHLQAKAFDAATKVGQVLIDTGYITGGQEIKKAVADF